MASYRELLKGVKSRIHESDVRQLDASRNGAQKPVVIDVREQDEVEQGIAKGDLLVFDNNSKKRFAEGHVPSAKWLDYKKVETADLPSEKGKRMVFYCSNEH